MTDGLNESTNQQTANFLMLRLHYGMSLNRQLQQCVPDTAARHGDHAVSSWPEVQRECGDKVHNTLLCCV